MFKELRASLILFALLMLLTGVVYPFVMLKAGQVLFAHQAEGSLITDKDKVIGSELIGQAFVTDTYFHPRPSAAGNGYDASNSSGSNLGPTSADLMKAVGARVADLKKSGEGMLPVDLVTSSASGLDPDISPAAAHFQIMRIAAARHMEVMRLNDLITQNTTPRTFGTFGQPRVNVLALNRALDQMPPSSPEPTPSGPAPPSP